MKTSLVAPVYTHFSRLSISLSSAMRTNRSGFCDTVLTVLVHLISIAYFLLLSSRFALETFTSSVPIPDLIVVAVYLVGTVTFSALCVGYRTVSLIDARLASSWRCLEQLAVVILIWCSTVPFVYFQFYHDERSLWLYLWLVTLAVVRCGRHVLWPDELRPHTMVSTCICTGALPLLCVCHAVVWGSACHVPMLANFLKYMTLTTLGGIVYVIPLPDHWRDMLGSSMYAYIMHLFVVYMGTLYAGKLTASSQSTLAASGSDCQTWM